jgi:hypothetical protein
VTRPSFVLGVEKRLLWVTCFCLWVSIRVWSETIMENSINLHLK